MKILHWDEMFHPSFGYQINVLSKFQARQGHEVIIMTSENINSHPVFSAFSLNEDIGKEDEVFSERHKIKIIRLPIYGVISGRVIYKSGYIKKMISEEPDVIMCHTNDTLSAMNIILNYKRINMPIVFDNHMLEMASQNPLSGVFRKIYKSWITPIIVNNKLLTIRTQEDNYVNKHLGIPLNLAPFISFGSDTTIFYPCEVTRNSFRKKYNICESDFVIIYAGKITSEKGGKLLAQAFEKKIETEKKVVIVVVGNANGTYEKEVDILLEKSENTIIRFSTQKYEDLSIFYKMADMAIFPKQCSLSFYDVQACGLPVIAEDNNINIERLSHGNGNVFASGDVNDFRNKITTFINMPMKEFKLFSERSYDFIKKKYDYEIIAKQYTQLLLDEYKRFKERAK